MLGRRVDFSFSKISIVESHLKGRAFHIQMYPSNTLYTFEKLSKLDKPGKLRQMLYVNYSSNIYQIKGRTFNKRVAF